jgi:hypothetical protein
MSKSGSTERQQTVRRQIIDQLGGCCVRCGATDARILQIDHIHGGGSAELRDEGGGLGRYYRIRRRLEMFALADMASPYQLLCAGCNWIKRHEEKEARGMNQHRKNSDSRGR